MILKHRSRIPLLLALTVSLLILLIASGTELATAGRLAQQAPQENVSGELQGWGDDGVIEVGVEWINDFPGTADDRSHWDESCDGLYYQLLDDGWTSSFRWTDWNAWENDFKNETQGGHEDSYVDKADIAMICTHGASTYDEFWNKNLSSVYFGSTHDDQHLSPGEAYQGYGDKDLEWLAFDSCSVLSEGGSSPYYNRGYWASTMNGLHLLLGFKNTMYVVEPGDGLQWAHYMNGHKFLWWWIHYPRTVMQAWFEAVDDVQPTVTCARVLAQEPDNINDYLHGKGYVSSDYYFDGDYYYWDHCSSGGKSQVKTIAKQPELISVPRLIVEERQVDEQFVVQRIAGAFGFSTDPADVYGDDEYFYMLDTSEGYTETLQVDKASGGFSYHNLSRLWVPTDVPPQLPNDAEAYGFAEYFFKMGGEGLPGVWNRSYNWTYELEELHEMEVLPDGNGGISEVEVASIPMDGVLTYPRSINAMGLTKDGMVNLAYPVFGAGARIKLYFGEGTDLIGMRGGMRDVTIGPLVAVMDAGAAWAKFLADPSIAVPQVSFLGDLLMYNQATLGYYEMPLMQHQSELIPVYEFLVNISNGGKLLEENVPIYIPAVEGMPPEVTIVSPVDGSTLSSMNPISFEGTIEGGTPPYMIAWSSSVDGFLSNEKAFSGYLSFSSHNGVLSTNQVELTVTDDNGLSDTATVSVFIKPLFWLPFLRR